MSYKFIVLTFSAAILLSASAKAEDAQTLLASADAAAGQKLSSVCKSCHSFEKGGPNKIGPNLWGIVGNVHAHADNFSYSDAMKSLHDQKWTPEALNSFIESPKTIVPGTKMPYPGMKNAQDRANLIAWLKTQSDNPAK